MYQRIGKAAYKVDLSNTYSLVNYLGNPETQFKSIHVAGTNGKGSTSHMLASVLQEAGYKVGLYTSPHLKDFRERIKINGQMIPKRNVSSFVSKHQAFFEANSLSFFEMTVGLAFDYFAKHQVDIAIIEVGLGGRLDSTNVITPEISVITNIGLDHVQFLGDTLPKIAFEKAGIIKPNIPVIIGETQPETQPVFIEAAAKNNAPIIFSESQKVEFYPSDLKGSYQKFNQRTILVVLSQLSKMGWAIQQKHVQQGLSNVIGNTGLLGRWQKLKDKPLVICDTAHNAEGLQLTMEQLQVLPKKNMHLVLGFVNDKDIEVIIELFPKAASFYLCQPKVARAMPIETLKDKFSNKALQISYFKTVKGAYQSALNAATMEDVIYIGGSTFVVAEVV